MYRDSSQFHSAMLTPIPTPTPTPTPGEGIKANATLEVLLLNGNAIGDDGARHLMAALKSNKSLEYLGLQAGVAACAHV